MQGVLHTEPIEHVALGTTTAPSVLEQAAHVAEVLRQAAVGATELPLFVIADYRADEFPTGERALHREWRARLLSQRYAEEVRSGAFPEDRHTYAMPEEEQAAFESVSSADRGEEDQRR